jgi:hypothetical protein
MNGKYYGVYDMRSGEEDCVGIFESAEEICAFFGGINKSRIWCGITRGNALTFGKKRYRVEVFEGATVVGIRKLLRERFGKWNHQITRDGGIWVRQKGESWQLFAADLEEAFEIGG